MTDLIWLQGYSGETTEQLIAMEGRNRVDSLVVAFEEALQNKEMAPGAAPLSAEERVVLAIEALEREVNNGGYAQFFLNESREYVGTIVDALRAIACPKTAEITDRAVRAVLAAPGAASAVAAGEWEPDAACEDALEACDNAYFEAPESIEDHLFEFIKANRHAIRVPG